MFHRRAGRPLESDPGGARAPTTPEGYRYVGREVVQNFVYDEDLSNVPLDRPHSSQDLPFVQSQTTVVDFVTLWDIVVVHLFEPVGDTGR